MALILILFSLTSFSASECRNTNDSDKMCQGKSFLAEEAGEHCRKEMKICQKEAKKKCFSGKVASVDCIQQYGGVWMTKCVCK